MKRRFSDWRRGYILYNQLQFNTIEGNYINLKRNKWDRITFFSFFDVGRPLQEVEMLLANTIHIFFIQQQNLNTFWFCSTIKMLLEENIKVYKSPNTKIVRPVIYLLALLSNKLNYYDSLEVNGLSSACIS